MSLAERIYDTIIANCMECGGEWMVSEKEATRIIDEELRKAPKHPCNDCDIKDCYSSACNKYQDWKKQMKIWEILND